MIFQQGTFNNKPGATPEEVARKREAINAMLRKYGSAKYTGEGLGHLATGIANGFAANRLNKQEAEGRKQASDVFSSILGGGYSAPDPVVASSGSFIAPDGYATQERNTAMVENKGSTPYGGPTQAAADSLDVSQMLAAKEQEYGLPSGYLTRTAQIESSFGKNMDNPNSSAAGPFQFIKSTAKQYGLTNPYDWGQSADAAARLAADNAAHLKRVLGRDPTGAELYLAHQQGAGGAAKLLANPNAPVSSVLGGDAVRLNGGSADMTTGQFANKWLGKFGGQQPTMSTQSSAPAYAQLPAYNGPSVQDLAQAMANPWMTPSQRQALGVMMTQAQQANDPMRQLEYTRAQQQVRLGEQELNQGAKPKPQYIEGVGIVDLNTGETIRPMEAPGGGGIDTQSSVVLDDGTTIIVTEEGERIVRGPDGELLSGQDAADAIRSARDYTVQNQRDIYAGRRTGTNEAEIATGGAAAGAGKAGEQAITLSGESYKQASLLGASNATIGEAIDAIDRGAKAGALDKFVPNITEASASLKNAMDRMGLDVVSATTFGALSEGELRLAMETAVPRNLDEADLRAWLVKKQVANQKAMNMLLDAALFFGTPGNTLAGWIERNRGAQPAPTPGSAQTPEVEETVEGVTKSQFMSSPSAIAAAKKYNTTVEKMWELAPKDGR